MSNYLLCRRLNKKSSKGFTIVELIVVMAMSVIIISILFSLLESSYNIYNEGIRLSNVESNGRITMETMSQNIKTSKLFIDTDTIKTMARFSNPIKFGDGSFVSQNNMVAYIEDNNDNRYMYALKLVNGKYELHKLEFSHQGYEKLSLSSSATEIHLSDADIITYSKDVQNIVDLTKDVNIDALKPGYLAAKVYYENYGRNPYLWVTAADNNQYFYVLDHVDNNDFSNQKDTVIASYITALSVLNKTELGTISLSVTDGDKSKNIDTSVSLLNNKH